jgi:hypothetical protein
MKCKQTDLNATIVVVESRLNASNMKKFKRYNSFGKFLLINDDGIILEFSYDAKNEDLFIYKLIPNDNLIHCENRLEIITEFITAYNNDELSQKSGTPNDYNVLDVIHNFSNYACGRNVEKYINSDLAYAYYCFGINLNRDELFIVTDATLEFFARVTYHELTCKIEESIKGKDLVYGFAWQDNKKCRTLIDKNGNVKVMFFDFVNKNDNFTNLHYESEVVIFGGFDKMFNIERPSGISDIVDAYNFYLEYKNDLFFDTELYDVCYEFDKCFIEQSNKGEVSRLYTEIMFKKKLFLGEIEL